MAVQQPDSDGGRVGGGSPLSRRDISPRMGERAEAQAPLVAAA